MAFALEEVHAIETEVLDFDEGVMQFRGRGRGRGVDVEGGSWASTIVDVW